MTSSVGSDDGRSHDIDPASGLCRGCGRTHGEIVTNNPPCDAEYSLDALPTHKSDYHEPLGELFKIDQPPADLTGLTCAPSNPGPVHGIDKPPSFPVMTDPPAPGSRDDIEKLRAHLRAHIRSRVCGRGPRVMLAVAVEDVGAVETLVVTLAQARAAGDSVHVVRTRDGLPPVAHEVLPANPHVRN